MVKNFTYKGIIWEAIGTHRDLGLESFGMTVRHSKQTIKSYPDST